MQKPFIFVLMPFSESFDDVYKLGIKATCEELNAYCERLDEQIFDENMLDRIYNQISKADIIIADLTDKNANVFYETGYAHALNKKVILLTKNSEDIPFDLKHHFHIVYSNIISLKQELKKRVKWYIANPKLKKSLTEFALKLYMNGTEIVRDQEIQVISTLSQQAKISLYKRFHLDIKIDVLNASNEIFDSNIKIGIITNGFYATNKPEIVNTIRISQEDFIHVSDKLPVFYPQSWSTVEYEIIGNQNVQLDRLPIIIRLFTEFGTHDIPVMLIINAQEFIL